MADPSTISAALLGVIRVSNNLFQVLNSLRKVDDSKFIEVYHMAVAQIERTKAWANRVHVVGEQIPPENIQKVKKLLWELHTLYERVDGEIRKAYPAEDKKLTTRLLTQRFEFVTGCFDEARQELRSIKATNFELERIAPALPNYLSSINERSGEVVGQVLETPGPSDPLETRITSPSEVTESTSQASASTEGVPVNISANIALGTIFHDCLDLLRNISTLIASQDLRKSLARMELWGIGIFEDNMLNLDSVLKADFNRNLLLWETIARSFVYIAIAEEQLLKAIERKQEERQAGITRRHRYSLLALIGHNNLITFAIEAWGDLEPDFPATESASAGSELGYTSQDTETDAIHQHSVDIEDSLHNLFDLLPGIRRTRQEYVLNLEFIRSRVLASDKKLREEANSSISSDQPTTETRSNSANETSVPLMPNRNQLDIAVEDNLRLTEQLEEALRADEDFAKIHGITELQFHSLKLQKERKALQKYRDRLTSDVDIKVRPGAFEAVSQFTLVLQEMTKKLIVEKGLEKEFIKRDSVISEKSSDLDKRIDDLLHEFHESNSVLLGQGG